MRPSIIRKDLAALRVAPNLRDLESERATFSWPHIRSELSGLPGAALNIAHEAIERHAQGPRAQQVALRWLGANGDELQFTYADLSALTNRFANAVSALGLARGDRLFILLPRIPELYIGALGAMKAGLVVSPLFSAFGPEPIATRVNLGSGRALLTTLDLYERKVAGIREQMPSLDTVLIAGDHDDSPVPTRTLNLDRLVDIASDHFDTVATRADEMALLHFTSGTTGKPKGAIHVHEAVLTHYATGRYALDLHDGDVFWCTADPGWVTGMSYGIIAPLLHGVTMIVDEAEFDPERWYRILQGQRVTVWYTAPTAIRMLMKAGDSLAKQFSFPQLRFIASVGEPLNPEAVWWGNEALGLPIHDNWWQTETGGIMIANTAAADIKPGSMGRPLPGIDAFVVKRRIENEQTVGVELIDTPDTEGELALRAGWPSMFRGYLGNEERYRKCFVDSSAGRLYLTEDMVRRDADGDFWFVCRADDVIKSAGHLIGPFEVESALMEHAAVAEAGVIGKPDPVVGESVKAFVSLKRDFEPTEALRLDLLGHARKRLGPAVAPKEIEFRAGLPRTRSGKIMRRLLKARELGLPEGDLSTLESDAR